MSGTYNILVPNFLVSEDEAMRQRFFAAQFEYDRLKGTCAFELRNLIGRSGMPMIQENGQRRYGPPSDYKGPPPGKGCEVFVGRIPRESLEVELIPLFERIGRIYELRIMMDFSGVNRGYAFVQYFTQEDALRAIAQYNNYEIRPGRCIGVLRSVDNCRLYVGSIPKDKTQEEIFQEVSGITEGVAQVIVYPPVEDKTKNRGFAFVEYENHRKAALARRKMLSGRITMWGQNVVVDWAQIEPDGLTLFVENISPLTSLQGLQNLFTGNSEHGVTGVSKYLDYAYVSFSTIEAAERARRELNGALLDHFFIEVTIAKPRAKNVKELQQHIQMQETQLALATLKAIPRKDLESQHQTFGFGPNSIQFRK